MDSIVTLLIAIVGSGGLSAVITSLLSARKFHAEASSIEQQTEQNKKIFEHEMIERLNKQFAELADRHKAEYEEQRKHTKILEAQVNKLNSKINRLISWIVTHNASYIKYLESIIKTHDSEFSVPKEHIIPEWIDSIRAELIPDPPLQI